MEPIYVLILINGAEIAITKMKEEREWVSGIGMNSKLRMSWNGIHVLGIVEYDSRLEYFDALENAKKAGKKIFQ